MNDQMKTVIDGLPDKPPRSRLEAYKEFIEELRRRGRTYKDIASILAEKFSIRVTPAGVHDFIRRRRPDNAKTPPEGYEGTTGRITQPIQPKPAAAGHTAVPPDTGTFEFDPDEPLRLTKPKKP